jgi:hypothetical protein
MEDIKDFHYVGKVWITSSIDMEQGAWAKSFTIL